MNLIYSKQLIVSLMVMKLYIVSVSMFLLIFDYFLIKVLSNLIWFQFKNFSTNKFMIVLLDAKKIMIFLTN